MNDYPHIKVWKKRTKWAFCEYGTKGAVVNCGDGYADHAEAIRAALGDAVSTSLPLYIDGGND